MKDRKFPDSSEDANNLESSPQWWAVVAWGVPGGAFVVATILSYREIHYNIPNDLRSPALLFLDVLLATVVAIGFAPREGSWTCWKVVHLCLRFGF